MAGIPHVLMGLLLLPHIKTGVNGEDNLILAGRGYDISFPCYGGLDLICFVIWQLSTREINDYVAVVSNGEIQTATSNAKGRRVGSKCPLHIKSLTAEDVGRYHCQPRQNILSLLNIPSSSPEPNFTPGQTVSLHCILLTYEGHRLCGTQQTEFVQLRWVNEAGFEVQEDSRHQIKRRSQCDVILIVTGQGEDNRRFRCQATVGQEVKTSVEVPVRAPVGGGGRGRGFITEAETEPKDRQLSDDPGHTTNAGDDMSEDDVTYAEINFPTGSERVRDLECQFTEYTSIRTGA
ncbi:uncharacterized protein [Centroberyx affinis]|uniref:uncharacterized protein n=1 Tax=Centroberyx affinis TaxID=166261 RepID=UPI003A5BB036